MDLNNINDDEWGPWIKAEDCGFLVDDIIILGLRTASNAGVYKIRGTPDRDRNTRLFRYEKGIWIKGHIWQMSGKTMVRFPTTKMSIKVAGIKTGCNCKKCNSKNEWAEPNQLDGSYICFECR